MANNQDDPYTSRGYSLPESMHDRIAREAELRRWNKSLVVRTAVDFWMDAKGQSREEPEVIEAAS